MWYARSHGFPEAVNQLTPHHIREFLVYVRDAEHRWGLSGNGSESSAGKASYTTLWHYYVSLCRLFRWAEDEGFMGDSPMANIKLRRPEKKIIEPYTREELKALVRVCQHDINNGSPFLGTRNKAIILVFLDSGIRLSELANIRLDDITLKVELILGQQNNIETIRAKLTGQLRIKTNLGYNLEFHEYGTLPRYDVKAKRFKDLRPKE